MQLLLRPRILQHPCALQCARNNLRAPTNGTELVSSARCFATNVKSASASISHGPCTLRRSRARPAQLTPSSYRRSFINIPNIFNNNNNTPQEIRTLSATRILPFPPSPLYDIIASVESYAEFLPFLTASTVTARDPASGYPSQAFLTVGYGPFTEKFTSRVTCDKSKWIVEARSGGGVGDDGKPIPGGDEGLFSHLSTKWELVPRSSQDETEVRLEIRFRFQNPMHTAMMSAVEDKIAGVMIEAFERRIKEQMTLNR